MLGGALLGLGLGSILSNGHAQEDAARMEEARQQGIREEAARQEAVRQESAREQERKKEGDVEDPMGLDNRPQPWENVGPSGQNKPVPIPDTLPGEKDAKASSNW